MDWLIAEGLPPTHVSRPDSRIRPVINTVRDWTPSVENC
jgi:hypothetical protein